MRQNPTLLLALLILMAFPVSAHAGANIDEGLYDPAPPENSAFIRFAHTRQSESGSEPAIANGKTYDYLEFTEVSSYFVVPEGEVKISLNKADKNFEAQAGNFYTVVLTGNNQLQLHQDETNNNRAKAQITVYNYSPDDKISLKTADGSVAIIEDLAKGEAASREINPVKVSLAVFNDNNKLSDLDAVSLERSQAYTVFVFPDRNVSWVRSTTNTVR